MNLDQSNKFPKIRNIINFKSDFSLKNFSLQQSISIDKLMIPYFGRHGAKQCMHGTLIRFRCKMWAAAICQAYCIQLIFYVGAESDIDPVLELVEILCLTSLYPASQIVWATTILVGPPFWLWPIFCFCLNLAVDDAFRLFKVQELSFQLPWLSLVLTKHCWHLL